MASTTAGGRSGVGVTGILLVLALAAGAGVGGFESSTPESGTATSTPCPPDAGPDKPLRSFHANKLGQVRLLCGDRKSGW